MSESRDKRRPRRAKRRPRTSSDAAPTGNKSTAADGPGSAGSTRPAGSRFAWVAPVLLLGAVAFGIWYFVFRDTRSGRVDELVTQAREAMGTFEYGRAELLLQQAIDLAPGNGLLHHNLAVAYMRQARFAEARREFETAASLYSPEANEVRAEEYWQLAQLDFQQSRWKDAETHLLRAIADHPTRALLHHRLIDLQLVRLNNVSGADSSTMRFLQFCGSTPENLCDAAEIYLTRRAYGSAVALARQAVAQSDTVITAHVLLGRSLWRGGQLEEALAAVEEPLKRFPMQVDLWVLKGGILVGMRRTDEALEALDTALKLDPKNYEANQSLMMALYVHGDYQAALDQAHVCQTLTEDENELRFVRGQMSRFQDALEGKVVPDSLGMGTTGPPGGNHP